MKTCFVVMPIGDQEFAGVKVSSSELRARYDDLIKEALLRANPNLDVVRADDVAAPGTMTTDIISRIMNSDIVVVDVTYPNPNVFYELGLRHACKCGTIIIKDRTAPRVPFDIAHLRHIEYENSPTGLKELSKRISETLKFHEQNANRPDNSFLEFAKLIGFCFPKFVDQKTNDELMVEAMMEVIQDPDLSNAIFPKPGGPPPDQGEVIKAMMKRPDVAKLFLTMMATSGQLAQGFGNSKHPQKHRRQR